MKMVEKCFDTKLKKKCDAFLLCNTGWGYGGFLNSPPLLNSQRLRQFLFRGPATSLRLPLTHSELSLETIMNK